jgi:uncharacterized protein
MEGWRQGMGDLSVLRNSRAPGFCYGAARDADPGTIMSSDPATERLLARERRRAERRQLLASGSPSPCVGICRLDDDTGLCVGCLRNVDEIRDWMILLPEERQAVLRRIEERRLALGPGAAP